MKKRLALFVLEVLAVMSLLGCGAQKYKVNADGGFELYRKSYAAGEEVKVYFKYIATDTDYTFYCENEDVKIKTDYDNAHGYVITFTMPDHDVTLGVKSRNTMTIDYDANPAPPASGPEPVPADNGSGIWKCPECGKMNAMLYCAECGRKKPGLD
ncbi:MAG: hypothetical protein J6X97_01865 [Lachnospiraceae bacterium]|nr:hypothetical protein [Lachnospiraceae bacterium]